MNTSTLPENDLSMPEIAELLAAIGGRAEAEARAGNNAREDFLGCQMLRILLELHRRGVLRRIVLDPSWDLEAPERRFLDGEIEEERNLLKLAIAGARENFRDAVARFAGQFLAVLDAEVERRAAVLEHLGADLDELDPDSPANP